MCVWGGGGGGACIGGYNGVRAVRPESVAGGGCFEVLWNLECPIGNKPKEKYVRISIKEIWRNLGQYCSCSSSYGSYTDVLVHQFTMIMT